MTEEAVKRVGFNAKGFDADGVVGGDNLSLDESTRHQGDTEPKDTVTIGDPKCE
jgi:hypothetical protein